MLKFRWTLVATLGLTGIVFGQSSTPFDSVQESRSADKSPSGRVRAALERHRAGQAARELAQTTGDTSGIFEQGGESINSGSTGLDGLLGDFLGSGLLGSLGNLGDLTGDGADTTSDDGSNVPSNITPEALALIESFGIDVNDLFPAKPIDGAQTSDKLDDQSQTVDPEEPAEPDFLTRWTDAMLETFFSAVSLGVRTPNFIQALEDLFSPVLEPILNAPAAKPIEPSAGETRVMGERAADVFAS